MNFLKSTFTITTGIDIPVKFSVPLHYFSIKPASRFNRKASDIEKPNCLLMKGKKNFYIQLTAGWTDIGGNHLIRFSSVPLLIPSPSNHPLWITRIGLIHCIEMFSHNLYILPTISQIPDSKEEHLNF